MSLERDREQMQIAIDTLGRHQQRLQIAVIALSALAAEAVDASVRDYARAALRDLRQYDGEYAEGAGEPEPRRREAGGDEQK